MGAVAVIFVDNKASVKPKDYYATHKVENLPEVYAAGYSGDVTIPSLVIGKAEGEGVKKYLCGTNLAHKQPCTSGGKVVYATIGLHTAATNIVHWDFWTAVDDLPSTKFKSQFATIAPLLGP